MRFALHGHLSPSRAGSRSGLYLSIPKARVYIYLSMGTVFIIITEIDRLKSCGCFHLFLADLSVVIKEGPGYTMSTVSKVMCGLLAAMYFMIGLSHLKDPEGSLRDFGVKGTISPIAKHCCAIIGSSALPIGSMLLYAITASADVRTALVLCFMTTIIPGCLVQVWYPFNDPPPAFPSEMPYPVIFIQVLFGVLAIVTNGSADKVKAK